MADIQTQNQTHPKVLSWKIWNVSTRKFPEISGGFFSRISTATLSFSALLILIVLNSCASGTEVGQFAGMTPEPRFLSAPAEEGDNCEIIAQKRIFKILFVLPLGEIKDTDLKKTELESVRHRTVMYTGDVIITIFGFLFSFISSTEQVEACETNLIALNKDEYDRLKKSDTALASLQEEKKTWVKSRNTDKADPRLKDFPVYLRNTDNTPPTARKEYSIYFDFNAIELNNQAREDLKKIKEKISSYDTDKKIEKILLLGHADPVGRQDHNVLLSWKRARAVKKELVKLGLNNIEIRMAGASSGWPASAGKSKSEASRRVDILLLLEIEQTRPEKETEKKETPEAETK